MPRDNGTHEPWSALRSLLSAPHARSSARQHHPKRGVLRAYISKTLPERPVAWTRDRAEALAAGTLKEWTRWEVVAHIADCSRCRRRIATLEGRLSQPSPSRLASLRSILHQPKWAPVGWALAGAQAVALVGLVLWSVFVSSPEEPTGKPLIYPSLNQVSQMEESLLAPALLVELVPTAPWEEVTTWLQSLEFEVHGPDVHGRYLLVGEGIEPDELRESRWVLRVELVGADGEE